MSFPENPGASTCVVRKKEERLFHQSCSLRLHTPLPKPAGPWRVQIGTLHEKSSHYYMLLPVAARD